MLNYYHYPILRLGFAGAFCYEALRVPPLLPEYLLETVQVVVNSLPPTEKWPIWLSAGATLLGSFGGALVGGLVAYIGTIKANHRLVRQGKLEECLALVMKIKLFHLKKLNFLSQSLEGKYLDDASAYIDTFDFDKFRDTAGQLLALSKIHAKKVEGIAETLLSSVGVLQDKMSIAYNVNGVARAMSADILREQIAESRTDIISLSNDLEDYYVLKAKA